MQIGSRHRPPSQSAAVHCCRPERGDPGTLCACRSGHESDLEFPGSDQDSGHECSYYAGLCGRAATDPMPSVGKPSLGQKLGSVLRQALSSTTNSAGGSVLPRITVETISITNG